MKNKNIYVYEERRKKALSTRNTKHKYILGVNKRFTRTHTPNFNICCRSSFAFFLVFSIKFYFLAIAFLLLFTWCCYCWCAAAVASNYFEIEDREREKKSKPHRAQVFGNSELFLMFTENRRFSAVFICFRLFIPPEWNYVFFSVLFHPSTKAIYSYRWRDWDSEKERMYLLWAWCMWDREIFCVYPHN